MITQTDWASEEVAFTKTTITLMKYDSSYRWQRSDGQWVSPIFTSPEAAKYMAGKIPFLTDDEWKEHYPIPKGEPYGTIPT